MTAEPAAPFVSKKQRQLPPENEFVARSVIPWAGFHARDTTPGVGGGKLNTYVSGALVARPMAGTPLISRSPASMPVIDSLNVTSIWTSSRTMEPAGGLSETTIGGTSSSGEDSPAMKPKSL